MRWPSSWGWKSILILLFSTLEIKGDKEGEGTFINSRYTSRTGFQHYIVYIVSSWNQKSLLKFTIAVG